MINFYDRFQIWNYIYERELRELYVYSTHAQYT